MKAEDRQKMIDAALTIKELCKAEGDDCVRCPFHRSQCGLRYSFPQDWEIPSLMNEEERAIAKSLLDAGFLVIARGLMYGRIGVKRERGGPFEYFLWGDLFQWIGNKDYDLRELLDCNRHDMEGTDAE